VQCQRVAPGSTKYLVFSERRWNLGQWQMVVLSPYSKTLKTAYYVELPDFKIT